MDSKESMVSVFIWMVDNLFHDVKYKCFRLRFSSTVIRAWLFSKVTQEVHCRGHLGRLVLIKSLLLDKDC